MKTKLAVLLITLSMVMVIIPGAVSAPAQTVTVTPAGDFNRGDTLTITLDGFAAGFVSVQITATGGTPVWAYQFTSTGAQKVIDLVIPDTWSKDTYTVYAKEDGGSSYSDTFYLYVFTPSAGSTGGITTSEDPYAVVLVVNNQDAGDAADTLESLDVDDAATVLELIDSDDAADIVEELDTVDAIEILEEADAGTVAEILTGVSVSTAVEIIDGMDPVESAAAVDQAVKTGDTDAISELLNDVEETVAGDILLNVDPGKGVAVVQAMATSDVHEAAKRVEEAVKRSGNAAKLAEFGGTLEGVSVDTLVSLFKEIAGLPATPSTVASVMAVMDITKVLDVVDAWMVTESYEDLSLVYSFLTDEKLEEVYLAMTTEQRNTIYPYLDEATASRVPDIGEFEVSDLSIVPATGETGDVFTVSVKVSNIGNETGMYTVNLKIDGSTEETDTVSLAPEMGETVTWTVSQATAGTYDVDVNGLTGSFEVTEPPVPVEPAEFQYGSLNVLPEDPEEGTDVTISVAVENIGGETGTESVELEIDGSVVDTDSVTLAAGASETVQFTYTVSGEGSHTVEIGGESVSYTVSVVVPPPAPFPIVYVAVGLVVIAAAAYFYMQSQKEA